MGGKKEPGPIGMLDSGVGGLTVAREVIRSLPEEEIIYYGDTLHLPYGPRQREEVRSYVFQIIDFLLAERSVKAIVLACNTATAFTLHEAQKKYSIPVFGTLAGASKRAVEISQNRKIGVIGTEGTVNSQAFQSNLMKLDSDVKVFAAACPRFVELVEAGNFSGVEVEKTANRYLDGLKGAGIDTLILGCTHFPYLIPVIQKVMGEDVTLINPGVEVARDLMKSLNYPLKSDHKRNGSQEFLVSDMFRISKTFLQEGSKFLKLSTLNFVERNIFTTG